MKRAGEKYVVYGFDYAVVGFGYVELGVAGFYAVVGFGYERVGLDNDGLGKIVGFDNAVVGHRFNGFDDNGINGLANGGNIFDDSKNIGLVDGDNIFVDN
ncbi:MAG: hypothetical protein FWF51_03040 [Chitinivibrionia bacterium]|nr:hypothetical protein [Chitinivibrionia bacterium]